LLKRIAIGFAIVLVLLLAGAIWLYVDVMGPGSDPEAEPTAAVTAPTAAPGQPVAKVPTASPEPPVAPVAVPGDPNRFVVTITEAQANEALRTQPEIRDSLAQANVSGVRLRFEPDQLVADARVPVWGKFKARISAAGRVSVNQGKLSFEVRSVRTGSLPAPRAVRDELEKHIGAALSRSNREHSGTFEAVEVRDGVMELRGRK